MGQVFVSFGVTNFSDVDPAAIVRRPPSETRMTALDEVLMDTGATHLCLPADLVARLGLGLGYATPVETATGAAVIRVFRNALVTYEDRSAVVEVIEVPLGRPPLLGAIPMEALGIEPDLRNRRVRKLARDLNSSYIRI